QSIAVITESFLTSYQDTGLDQGTTYYYRVFAVNSFGPSLASNTANATTQGTSATPPPTAPTNLTATAVSTSRIDLSWTATSATHTGFLLQRRSGAGDWTTVATPGATVTTYQDTGLTAGTTYLYRIQATSLVGPSAFSAEATATTQSSGGGGGGGSAPPPTPTGLIVTATSNTSATVSWNASAGATEYRLYRSMSSSSTLTLIATTSASGPSPTRYLDTALIANVTYLYQVAAVNASGASEQTTTASVTIPVSAFALLENQETVTRSIGRSGQQFFLLYVPEGAKELVVTMTGDVNVDLLVQLNRQPTATTYICSVKGSQGAGRLRTRSCSIRPVIPGDWHILAQSSSIGNVSYTLNVFFSVTESPSTHSVPDLRSPLNRGNLPPIDRQERNQLDQDRRRRTVLRPE
ncbi:MAG: fibronectin type III domain-containing protein, partial [Blastocatellia bacterium]